jgi:preprotein translocase subunit SecE
MLKRMIDNVKEFLGDVRTELKKVSFPTKAETIGSTTVVIVFCVLMSIYLSMIDSFLSWLVGKIICATPRQQPIRRWVWAKTGTSFIPMPVLRGG